MPRPRPVGQTSGLRSASGIPVSGQFGPGAIRSGSRAVVKPSMTQSRLVYNPPPSITGTGAVSIATANAGTGALQFRSSGNVFQQNVFQQNVFQETSKSGVAIPTANAGTGTLRFSGPGAVAIATANAGTGTNTGGGFTGTGAVAIATANAGTGTYTPLNITGTGAVAIATANAGTGTEKFSGSGGVAIATANAGTGTFGFTGTGAVAIATANSGSGLAGAIGSGAVAIATANAGAGSEKFSGSGTVAIATANAGSGALRFSGTGAVAIATTDAGTGGEQFVGSATVAIATANAGAGFVPYSLPSYGGPSVRYVVELFSPDANWGPGTKLAELSGVRNLGWAQYDRMAAKGFFTLSQNDSDLQYILRNHTHVRITRVHNTNTTVYAGVVADYVSTGDDVVLALVDYIGLLAKSRCGYRTMYPNKKLGTEIVSPEWALAKNATHSILAFVTTGTIEDPLADDGTTQIVTDNQFGLLDQSRLRLFYDLSEMGRANTDNHVTFGITRDSPYTFSFLKNQGTTRSFGLDLNGRVVDYHYTPNWIQFRNDLATIGQDSSGGSAEITASDSTSITNDGLQQDVFQIATLLGLAGSAVASDQQQAAAARMLHRGLNPLPGLALQILEGSLDPGVDYVTGDKAPVEIVRGIDNIHSPYRIMGTQSFYSDAGEQLTVLVQP